MRYLRLLVPSVSTAVVEISLALTEQNVARTARRLVNDLYVIALQDLWASCVKKV